MTTQRTGAVRADAAPADVVRVAIICPYDLSRPGGVQGQVLGLARALAVAGHEPTVVAPCGGRSALPADGTGVSVPVVSVGGTVGLPANGSVAPVSLNPRAAMRGWRAVRDGRFDVVHLHEPLAPGPGLACLWRGRLPSVGTFHRSGDSLAYTVLAPLARRAASRLTVRCAVSEEAAATARRALGGTYEVVGNGVDLEHFAGAVPWPTTGPTVLFVGRHETRKGLGVLLDAVARLGMADGARPTVWVVGTGPETDALRRRHGPGGPVQWLGAVDDDELARRLAGAHVVCAPSLGGESFGVVLLEAMAARSVVVASDIPGYAAVVGDHGVLVPPGDVAALAAALTTALADVAAGSGHGSPGALDAAVAQASRWSMPAVAARYVEIYRRAGAPGSPP